MLVRKLTPDLPEAVRRLWRIVRLDTHLELAGEVVSADADTGVAMMKEASGDTKEYCLGPGGLAIVGRA
jgi:hypothetical protein